MKKNVVLMSVLSLCLGISAVDAQTVTKAKAITSKPEAVKAVENSKVKPNVKPNVKPEVKPNVPITVKNPLIGKWTTNNQNVGVEVVFKEDKAIFSLYYESGREEKFEMNYKFTPKALVLDYKTKSGKVAKINLTYSIKEDVLTYKFINTKTPAFADFPWELYKRRTEKSPEKPVDAEFEANKRPVEEEKVNCGGH